MLPAEITTIAGSDFDVDKMYVMLHETETQEGSTIEELIDEVIEFSEDELKEAEEIKEYCQKGVVKSKKSGKFGR
jgi:hypothetical protein